MLKNPSLLSGYRSEDHRYCLQAATLAPRAQERNLKCGRKSRDSPDNVRQRVNRGDH
jgi:hypothetical protein